MVKARKQDWWRSWRMRFEKKSLNFEKHKEGMQSFGKGDLVIEKTEQLETGESTASKRSEKIHAFYDQEASVIINNFKISKNLKQKANEFQNILLEGLSTQRVEKENILRKIVVAKEGQLGLQVFKALFNKFDEGVVDWEKKRDFCLYILFMLFAQPASSKEEQQAYLQVLEWLASENQIEKILEQQGSVSMIHSLALKNNWTAMEWCFDRYRQQSNGEKNKELFFTTTGDTTVDDDSLFKYVVTGTVCVLEEGCYPDERVLEGLLKEFRKVIADQEQKEQKAATKKKLMEELILSETEMPLNLAIFFKKVNV